MKCDYFVSIPDEDEIYKVAAAWFVIVKEDKEKDEMYVDVSSNYRLGYEIEHEVSIEHIIYTCKEYDIRIDCSGYDSFSQIKDGEIYENCNCKIKKNDYGMQYIDCNESHTVYDDMDKSEIKNETYILSDNYDDNEDLDRMKEVKDLMINTNNIQ